MHECTLFFLPSSECNIASADAACGTAYGHGFPKGTDLHCFTPAVWVPCRSSLVALVLKGKTNVGIRSQSTHFLFSTCQAGNCQSNPSCNFSTPVTVDSLALINQVHEPQKLGCIGFGTATMHMYASDPYICTNLPQYAPFVIFLFPLQCFRMSTTCGYGSIISNLAHLDF